MCLRRVALIALLLSLGSASLPCHAQPLWSIGWGHGSADISRLRLAASYDLQPPWWPDWLPRPLLTLQPGLSYWQYRGGSSWSVSVLPEIGWQRPLGSDWQLTLGAGIGVAAFSDTTLASRQLGSAFQFEDRLSIGVLRPPFGLWLRGYHYSNGNLTAHNDGINLISLEWGWQLP